MAGALLPARPADGPGAGPFTARWRRDLFVARTGYTGEDGFELVLPTEAGMRGCGRLLAAGAQPCGLGARDTLRLEAA
jgi:aminomethyltransferase